MFNAHRNPEAVEAFDSAIQAEPQRAESHYYKAMALAAQAQVVEGKMVYPPGAADAFKQYLKLAPKGPLAENARLSLDGIRGALPLNSKKPAKKH